MIKTPFISDPNYYRRLFLPYKKRVDKKVKSILSVKAKYLRIFDNRSYHVKYLVLVKRTDNKEISHAFHGLTSPDPTRLQSFKVMNYLWKKDFSSGNYSIPEPIAYLKKYSMVITREIKGKTFFETLEKKSFPKIYYGLKKSADWLKKLHNTPPYSFKDVFSTYSKEYWQKQFQILKEAYPEKSSILRRIIREILLWEDFNEKSSNPVITHHDFHSKNIFLTKEKIYVLDFSESRLSRAIVDIFTFLIQLELLNYYFKKPFSSNHLQNFSKIFIKEYFGPNWQKVLKDSLFKKDFNILRKRVAAQSLAGWVIAKRKPKIFSNILFRRSEKYLPFF